MRQWGGEWYHSVMAQLVELDSRRRISLGQLARHDRYIVTQEPDGTLVLTPAVVMADPEYARWSEFMIDDVWPQMADLLDMPAYDPENNPAGFSCANCHLAAE